MTKLLKMSTIPSPLKDLPFHDCFADFQNEMGKQNDLEFHYIASSDKHLIL